MVKVVRRIGNSYGVILDRRMLDELAWTDGQQVDVEIAPNGKGLTLSVADPAAVEAARKARKARVRSAVAEISDEQESVLRKLAE